jgi:hypothetical protein
MTARDYVNGLTWQEFQDIKKFKESSPDFYSFLAAPCDNVFTVANFAIQCRTAGIPDEFTQTSEALHYLVIAINDRLCGK